MTRWFDTYRHGYLSGSKPVSDFDPPPAGPAPGATTKDDTMKTPMYAHTLRLTHDRSPMALSMADADVDSAIDVEAHSNDLTEVWRELLSRIPADVYAALRVAMVEAARLNEQDQT